VIRVAEPGTTPKPEIVQARAILRADSAPGQHERPRPARTGRALSAGRCC